MSHSTVPPVTTAAESVAAASAVIIIEQVREIVAGVAYEHNNAEAHKALHAVLDSLDRWEKIELGASECENLKNDSRSAPSANAG